MLVSTLRVHQKVWGNLNHTIRLSILKHSVKLLNISRNCTKNSLPHTFDALQIQQIKRIKKSIVYSDE